MPFSSIHHATCPDKIGYKNTKLWNKNYIKVPRFFIFPSLCARVIQEGKKMFFY